MPQQSPKPLQQQHWIINPLHHKRTPWNVLFWFEFKALEWPFLGLSYQTGDVNKSLKYWREFFLKRLVCSISNQRLPAFSCYDLKITVLLKGLNQIIVSGSLVPKLEMRTEAKLVHQRWWRLPPYLTRGSTTSFSPRPGPKLVSVSHTAVYLSRIIAFILIISRIFVKAFLNSNYWHF